MTNSVTLRVTTTATVIVDIEKARVHSVEWDQDKDGHRAFEASALYIPGSQGETNAIRILIQEKHWLR